MNTVSAVKILKNKGWKVEAINRKSYRVKHFRWDDYRDYNARELIVLARCYTHDNKRTTNINKDTKKEHNSKNRAATRDALNIADYDAIPLDAPTDCGDRWNWD
jgi:hypothetical protein